MGNDAGLRFKVEQHFASDLHRQHFRRDLWKSQQEQQKAKAMGTHVWSSDFSPAPLLASSPNCACPCPWRHLATSLPMLLLLLHISPRRKPGAPGMTTALLSQKSRRYQRDPPTLPRSRLLRAPLTAQGAATWRASFHVHRSSLTLALEVCHSGYLFLP